jgi:shikimate kinase
MRSFLFLTGFRGTGKSAVAGYLASSLAAPAIDLDREIQSAAGESIAEIFANGGERRFRQLESECLETISQGPVGIVALGGGAILAQANRERMREVGRCVWLTAQPETIVRRIAGDTNSTSQRPRLTALPQAEEVRHLLEQREPLYREAADWTIATDDRTPEEIAAEIARWWLG